MLKFDIPKSPVAYGMLDFANHVLDHSPVYETRAQMRLGYKAVEAIESAVNAGEESALMDDAVGQLFKAAVDKTPIPRMFVMVDGKPGEPVPARFYTQFYEAVEKATEQA